MGLREEIIYKIKSAEVKPFDDLVFVKDTVYIRELPREDKSGGFLSTVELTIVTDSKESHLYHRLKEEIGFHGVYGRYFIQLIKYIPEDVYFALDNIWTQKVNLKIFWEENN
jgi:hypothetical protein